MVGKYTSEEIHEILQKNIGVCQKDLFEIFENDCRNIDINLDVLDAV